MDKVNILKSQIQLLEKLPEKCKTSKQIEISDLSSNKKIPIDNVNRKSTAAKNKIIDKSSLSSTEVNSVNQSRIVNKQSYQSNPDNKHNMTKDSICNGSNMDITPINTLEEECLQKMADIININGDIATKNVEQDGWKIVREKKKKWPRVMGMATSADLKIHGVPRKTWLFIGRVQKTCSEEDVEEYVKSLIGGEVSLQKLNTKSQHSCFKLGADIKFKEKLMNPESWPEGIVVSPYRFINREAQGGNFTPAANLTKQK